MLTICEERKREKNQNEKINQVAKKEKKCQTVRNLTYFYALTNASLANICLAVPCKYNNLHIIIKYTFVKKLCISAPLHHYAPTLLIVHNDFWLNTVDRVESCRMCSLSGTLEIILVKSRNFPAVPNFASFEKILILSKPSSLTL